MATHKSNKLLGLLEEQKSALQRSNYRQAERLSHHIDTLIRQSRPGSLSPAQRERITRSFAHLELILASQKQVVLQQLQTLRRKKRILKTYGDQTRA